MRLWSLHPAYLDRAGLVALWREGLLARAVLSGATRGYRNHPQLERFRAHRSPVGAIDAYLWRVADEATGRGYSFDTTKLGRRRPVRLQVTRGQLALELAHLRAKLERRDPERAARLPPADAGGASAHPCFTVVPGGIAAWERARP